MFEVLDLQNTAKKSSDILQNNKEDLVWPVTVRKDSSLPVITVLWFIKQIDKHFFSFFFLFFLHNVPHKWHTKSIEQSARKKLERLYKAS